MTNSLNLRGFYWLSTVFFGSGAIIFLALGTVNSDDRFVLVCVGLLGPALLAVFQAALRRRVSLFEPINLIFMYSIVGFTLTAFFIAFGSGYRHQSVTNGEPSIYFVMGGLWGLLAIAVFSLGYALITARFSVERLMPRNVERVPRSLLFNVALSALAISVFGTLGFLQQTGGLSLDSISNKRWIEVGAGAGETVRAAGGYLRLLSGLSATAAVFLMAYFAKRDKIPFVAKLVLLLLCLAAMALPFVSSSRSDIVFIIGQLLLAYAAFRPIPVPGMLVGIVIALILFGLMSNLRSSHLSANPITSLGSSGNGISLAAISHITARVPQRMGYKYGESYFRWLYSPIPRALWPDKPPLGLGAEIKVQITHGASALNTGERPPGFAGEGYINFGPVGIIFGALLFSTVARVGWNTFRPLIGNNVVATTAFLLILPPICQFSNSGFSELVTRIAIELISLALIVIPIAILTRARSQRQGPTGISIATR
jgi:oligosaccharide repeat unit polymerase